MIVREPEKRATLDEVMADAWYLGYGDADDGEDDDDDDEPTYFESFRSLPKDDHKSIVQQMVAGNIADEGAILQALEQNEYNHITATYYLLADKLTQNTFTTRERNTKRQRRSLQVPNDPFAEQIGVLLPSATIRYVRIVSCLTCIGAE